MICKFTYITVNKNNTLTLLIKHVLIHESVQTSFGSLKATRYISHRI